MNNKYENKYLKKYSNKQTKTFTTDGDIYNSFKITCTQLEKHLGYTLTELMDEYTKNHELRKEYLQEIGNIGNFETPKIFEHDIYWEKYLMEANPTILAHISKRFDELTKLAKRFQKYDYFEPEPPTTIETNRDEEDEDKLDKFFWN